MADKPDLKVGFGTPFAEQIDFLRAKLNLPTDRWDDIERSAHDRAFIVAGAAKADLLNDLRGAVDQAVRGGSLDRFRKDFDAIVARHGWTGWTGEGSPAGVAWRTKVIYQTNLLTSYAAGRYRQLTEPEMRASHPVWEYIHSDSVLHPRPQHQAWNGLTLPADHPFWQTHYPPNGWGCRCRVRARARPLPDAPTEPPSGWNDVNAKTGEPDGIDKGFGYAPGAGAKRSLQSMIDDKLIKLDGPIGQAMRRELAPVLAREQAGAAPAVVTKAVDTPAAADAVFVPQKTAKAAAQWAVRNDLVDIADYTGIKPEAANEWNLSLFNHVREFPALRKSQRFTGSCQAQFALYAQTRRQELADKLVSQGVDAATAARTAERLIKTPKVTGNVYAHSWAQPQARGIALNAKWGNDPAAMRQALQRDVANQYHPVGTDTIRSVADHEFGHQLDDLLSLAVDADVIRMYTQAKSKGLKAEVSGYAAKNIKEFIAECWAESCNSANPRPAARALAELVRQRYRHRFGGA